MRLNIKLPGKTHDTKQKRPPKQAALFQLPRERPPGKLAPVREGCHTATPADKKQTRLGPFTLKLLALEFSIVGREVTFLGSPAKEVGFLSSIMGRWFS